MRLINLIGFQFGRLTVIRRAPSKDGKGRWFCKCSCPQGTVISADASNLKRGNVTSCGCFRKEFVRANQLPDGVSGFNGLYSRYKGRARQDQIPFELSKTEFAHLTQQPCYYCGKEPSQSISSRNTGKGRYTYNGIDRLDSRKGYVLSNCVTCCSDCNYMKTDMSVTEFIDACKRIINNLENKAVDFGPTAKASLEMSVN